jgi:hypothetical protein
MVPIYSLPTELDELAESGQDKWMCLPGLVRPQIHILAKVLGQALALAMGFLTQYLFPPS